MSLPSSPPLAAQPDTQDYSAPLPELLLKLGSTPAGLAGEEAGRRLLQYGPNAVKAEDSSSTLRLALHQFESPLVLILVFAAVVSLLLGEWIESSIIIVIVLGSTLLGFVQEYRASSAVAQLRARLALKVRVHRDGRIATVPSSDVVPGDVVELSAGNLVPADGRILVAADFLVTEASLTGESYPVEKQPGELPAGTPVARRSNAVFLGTSVRSGTAVVLITRTGSETALGAIAKRLHSVAPETEFARGVRRFGGLLVRMMVLIVLFVLTANYWLGRPVLESLLFAVALAVGLSPELLPAIVSITLSAGARAMAQRGVIVRRLEAIQNLGSMTILCTDKTGTLTKGDMRLENSQDVDGKDAPPVLLAAFLNASFETGIENPLDKALVEAGGPRGLSVAGFTKQDEIPYDFLRRRLSIVLTEDASGTRKMITKGAVTQVLSICSTVLRNGAPCPMDEATLATARQYSERLGAQGFRILAVASREVPAQAHYSREDEQQMTLLGFVSFQDPPKDDVTATLGRLKALGVSTKIITGDNRHVAAFVAASVGLNPQALLLGEEIARMSDEALWQRARTTDLFAEIDPQQKESIVRALQRNGHAVGYLGDGINDAPALHAADVGISVDGAVDVARESADVLLLKPDLDVLCQGVRDGRRTFANTLKYISITTSANFGNMISMALVTPILPFLPLLAKQILLNNLLADLPSMAISSDAVDASQVDKPTHWELRSLQKFMIVFGLLSSCFDALTFFLLLKVFHVGVVTFQTAWWVESLLTELAVLMVLRTHGPCWKSRPSVLLRRGALAVGCLTLLLPFSGPLARLFGFQPLSWPLMLAMVGVMVSYVAVTEVVKRWYFSVPAQPQA